MGLRVGKDGCEAKQNTANLFFQLILFCLTAIERFFSIAGMELLA